MKGCCQTPGSAGVCFIIVRHALWQTPGPGGFGWISVDCNALHLMWKDDAGKTKVLPFSSDAFKYKSIQDLSVWIKENPHASINLTLFPWDCHIVLVQMLTSSQKSHTLLFNPILMLPGGCRLQWPLELVSGSFTELTHSPFLPLLFTLVRWMTTANVYRLVWGLVCKVLGKTFYYLHSTHEETKPREVK